jgi:hypothetical protein
VARPRRKKTRTAAPSLDMAGPPSIFSLERSGRCGHATPARATERMSLAEEGFIDSSETGGPASR